jgi:hypothetical protein
MKMRQAWFAEAALIPLCLLGGLAPFAKADPETTAASVLFQHFETVAKTPTNYLISFETRDPNGPDYDTASLELPFMELLGGLKVLGPRTESDLERSYSTVFVGAKDFGRGPYGPGGFGMVSSRKCYIAVLEGAEPSLVADFNKASYESIEGRRVWTWSVPSEGGSTRASKFYAAQVSGLYFVMANDQRDFQEVVHALTLARSFKPLSQSVSGWGTFNTHKYWAYRLVYRGGITKPEAAGIEDMTPDVIALSFYADVDTRTGLIQVFSSDTSMKAAPTILAGPPLNRLQPQGAGVWQQSVPLSNDQADFNALFQVFYLFGFGVNA